MRALTILLVLLFVLAMFPTTFSTPRSGDQRSAAAISPAVVDGGVGLRIPAPSTSLPSGAHPASSGPASVVGSDAPSPAGPPVSVVLGAGTRNVHPEPSITEMRHVAAPPAVVSGLASWWSIGPGIYVALPGYVDGTTVRVRVCAGSRCVVALAVTQCACNVGSPRPIIDLSADLFREFAPLSVGLIRVTVQR